MQENTFGIHKLKKTHFRRFFHTLLRLCNIYKLLGNKLLNKKKKLILKGFSVRWPERLNGFFMLYRLYYFSIRDTKTIHVKKTLKSV